MQVCPACAVYKYKSSELSRTAASSVGEEHRSGTQAFKHGRSRVGHLRGTCSSGVSQREVSCGREAA